MKVGVIGAGSMGLLFAAYLSRGFDVTIYTRTEEQASEINKHGIMLKQESGRTISYVTALPSTEWKGTEDLSIITVKQYQLDVIIDKINQLPVIPKNLLFLQNGMGHLNQLESMSVPNIFVGTIEHGALRENHHTVIHNGTGITNVAVFKGDSVVLNQFVSSAPIDFPFVLRDQYDEMLLKKLMANAIINPLTALLGVENGELVHNPYYFKVVNKLIGEISAILKLENDADYLQQVVGICLTTADNRSSMLKDLEAKRLTEIDAILGFILTEAKRQNHSAPLIESLYYFIKGKETGEGGGGR